MQGMSIHTCLLNGLVKCCGVEIVDYNRYIEEAKSIM